MTRYLYTALRISFLTILLLGVGYPLLVTGLAQLFFPQQARGSLVHSGSTLVGSTLIGQTFTGPGYFHSRPSAADTGYDAAASGGSNLGPTSSGLVARVTADVQTAKQENPGLTQVPVDMVTTSASGLDPDITPANAFAQAPRVARERKLSVDTVQQLVTAQTTGRQFGILGEPRVNVLQLNQALDALAQVAKP